MAFVVIEGLDGSGKSTQLQILMDYLENENRQYRYLHFPRTDSPVYGELIASFLRGDLGDLGSVNPYLVALIYAGDRMDAAPLIREWLQEGFLVVVDRYVCSNIAFQCAKIHDGKEKKKLWDWIIHLEYEYNGIPRPDLNIFLDVPFGFTRNNLTVQREGSDRKYLGGSTDIHEEDLEFQKKVRDVYHLIAQSDEQLQVIDCAGAGGQVLPPEGIFSRLLEQLKPVIKK